MCRPICSESLQRLRGALLCIDLNTLLAVESLSLLQPFSSYSLNHESIDIVLKVKASVEFLTYGSVTFTIYKFGEIDI